jgi:hypothetical protein
VADLAALADQLEKVLAQGEPEQTKALLRILIAALRVNSKTRIEPTYRIVAPGVCATSKSGDGGNRTHVRDCVRMASTSVAGALISSLTRLAGGVVGDQSPRFPRLGGDGPRRVSPLSDSGLPRRRQAGPETSLA